MKQGSDYWPKWLQHSALCLLCAWGASAHAQPDMADLPLEQLMQLQVTTASRYAQTALEAPATVSVVTADDIRLFGYRNLSEVLGSMRGLHVSYDRSYHYLGTRGFATPGDYNTRVLLLVNGVRFNDNPYDQAAIGTDFPIDLDLVDRV
jgi:iron complex outermembrane receptor protein